jgi:hypothetical protein
MEPMPRPKDGYENRTGQQVLSVHDITGRYKDMHGFNELGIFSSDPGPELARPPVPAEQGELARISHCQVASRLANCAEASL